MLLHGPIKTHGVRETKEADGDGDEEKVAFFGSANNRESFFFLASGAVLLARQHRSDG